MAVPLAGPLRHLIDDDLERARKAEETGKKAEAVALYRQAASLYRQLAAETDIAETKRQRLQNAGVYEKYAETLATGRSEHALLGAQLERGDVEDGALRKHLECLITRSSVSWDDIGGLDETKDELKLTLALSVVGMPPGVRLDSWKAILLYGPPGTGKTMLAAAASNGLGATFLSVPLGSILSKYFGESSRLASALYDLARERAPAVVHMDEFESLAAERTGEESGAERRILSTLLSELDGLTTKTDTRYVLTMVSSNVPWLLDKAILSRFQRRIFMPLPDSQARYSILEILLRKRGLGSALPIDDLVAATEWFSGRELEALVRSASYNMVVAENPRIIGLVNEGFDKLGKHTLKIRVLDSVDWNSALGAVRPVANRETYQLFLDFERNLHA